MVGFLRFGITTVYDGGQHETVVVNIQSIFNLVKLNSISLFIDT